MYVSACVAIAAVVIAIVIIVVIIVIFVVTASVIGEGAEGGTDEKIHVVEAVVIIIGDLYYNVILLVTVPGVAIIVRMDACERVICKLYKISEEVLLGVTYRVIVDAILIAGAIVVSLDVVVVGGKEGDLYTYVGIE